MYGYVASKFVPLMLLEYCELGDVLHYVYENSEIILVKYSYDIQKSFNFQNNANGIKELTSYTWQICDGMVCILGSRI